jgi:hypothetical protein
MEQTEKPKMILEQEFLVRIRTPYGWAVHSSNVAESMDYGITTMMPESARQYVEIEVSESDPYPTSPLWRKIPAKIRSKIHSWYMNFRWGYTEPVG